MAPFLLNKDLIDEREAENIGSGAYGTITKIKYCGAPCAAKEIHPVLLPEVVRSLTDGVRLASDDTGKNEAADCVIAENFYAEIKMLSEIRHPNFVRFIGVYFRDSSPFPVLVVELMFTSLAQCLTLYESDKQKFSTQIRLLILQDVARAVVYLHSRNPPIAHRDLTANNVLLTPNMSAKVADLGVAKIVDISKFMSTKCPGAMVYMAPETLMKYPQYGLEIDVYSYGVLGFHTLTGILPLHHGARKDDGSLLTDVERCHADLITKDHEEICLKETFVSCLQFDPHLRLKASEILDKVDEVVRLYKVEEHSFSGFLFNEKRKADLVIKMDQTITSQTEDLMSKDECILKLMADKEKLSTDIQLLCSNNSGCVSTIRQLEKKQLALTQEVERLHLMVQNQEKTIEDYSGLKILEDPTAQLKDLIKAEQQISAHSQLCSTLEGEKRDLSEEVRSLKALNLNLSSKIKNKEKQLVNKKKDLQAKEEELELYVNKTKLLEEKIDTLEKRLDRKPASSEESSTFVTTSLNLDQYKKIADLLKIVEELKRQNAGIEKTHQTIQARYRTVLQELLIPHLVCCISNKYNIDFNYVTLLQGILHSCSSSANLYLEEVDAVDLQPVGRMASTLHSIKTFPGSSMLEKNFSVVYNFQSDKIFFLSDLYLNGFSELYCGIALCYDPLSGRFDVIEGPEDQKLCKILSICRLGDSIIALDKHNQFVLLVDSKWVHSSIPPLPNSCKENPIILTYMSLLIVIDGNIMWVYDDGVGNWMKFQLSTSGGVLESSPRNCFIVLAGNLFICCYSQELVYCVALQQVFDSIVQSKCCDTGSVDKASLKKEIAQDLTQNLQLSVILKGSNFIYCRADDILAFHTTQTTLVSSVYIDRAWYYNINCCHWHNIECDESDLTHGCWLSMADCAGIIEFSSAWSGWGHAKLSKVQLKKQKGTKVHN